MATRGVIKCDSTPLVAIQASSLSIAMSSRSVSVGVNFFTCYKDQLFH